MFCCFFPLFLIDKIRQYYLPGLETTGFSVQEKKFKIHFQNGGAGGKAEFSEGNILASFVRQVTAILPIKFQVN